MFGIIYSALGYVAFLSIFGVFVLFTDGLLLPKTVDTAGEVDLAVALTLNLGLILAFGLQHSLMARQSFKKRLTAVIPEKLERSTFVWASSIALGLLMVFWQPIDGVLWRVESKPLVTTLWVLNGLGWVGVPLTSYLIDHFHLFGLKQTWSAWRKRSVRSKGFVTPSLYRYVRHPMMTSILIALWAAPTMGNSHALLAAGMSVYVLIGVHFEERSLLRELGDDYARYQQEVPKLVPQFSGRKAIAN
jgi:protein-S-isoprenylcysteine O-methyltransferase Ste14